MELPRLRLRRVFEHPTHFKVVKPTGQTIKIAKKSLSPSSLNRLRKYAQGGEVVQHFDNGGPVEPAEDAAKRRSEAVAAGLDPDAFAVPVPGSEPEEAVAALPESVSEPAVVRRMPVTGGQESVATPTSAQLEAEMQAQRAAAAPPPVVVNVNNAPAPVVEKPVEAVATEPVEEPTPETAPVAATPKMGPKVVVEPVARVTPEAAPAEERPVATRLVDGQRIPIAEVIKAGKGVKPSVVTPTSVQSVAAPIAAAPTVTPPASGTLSHFLPPASAPASVAAVSPVVAPAPVAAPAPVSLANIGPLTVDAIVAEKKKSPNASISEIVSTLTGLPPKLAELAVPQSMKSLELSKGKQFPAALVEAAVDNVNAAVAEARAAQEQVRINIESVKAQQEAAAEKALKDAKRREDIDAHVTELGQAVKDTDTLKSFFGSQGIGQTIFSLAALAIGGALSGYTRTPNYVLDAFNKAVDKDIEEQKRRRTSNWARYNEALGDRDAADAAIRVDNDVLMKTYLQQQAARIDSTKIQPQLMESIAKIEAQLAKDLVDLDAKMALAEDRREKPVVRPTAGRSTTAGESLAWRKQKFERESTLNVAQQPLEIRSPTGADKIQQNIIARTNAFRAANKTLKLLKDTPLDELANVFSGERAKAIAELNLLIERFPEAFGFTRAISVNAGKVLKAALQDPTSAKSLFLAFMSSPENEGRPVWQGVQALTDEIAEGRENYIMSNALVTEDGLAKARRALEALSEEDARALAGKNISPGSATRSSALRIPPTPSGATPAPVKMPPVPAGRVRMKTPSGQIIDIPQGNVAKAKAANYVEYTEGK